eukprot:1150195-Pelagomonas_calceolata.AAC.6
MLAFVWDLYRPGFWKVLQEALAESWSICDVPFYRRQARVLLVLVSYLGAYAPPSHIDADDIEENAAEQTPGSSLHNLNALRR